VLTWRACAQLPAARCYTLHFEGQADRDLFFWMQEPKAEQDEARVAAVNSALGASGARSHVHELPCLLCADTPRHRC
jgi:hypothetical protein